MFEQANLRQEFLKKFLLEIILIIKKNKEYEKNQKLEEERKNKAIESEKLRLRFESYPQVKVKSPPVEYIIPAISLEKPTINTVLSEQKIQKTELAIPAKTIAMPAEQKIPSKSPLPEQFRVQSSSLPKNIDKPFAPITRQNQSITQIPIPPQVQIQPGEINFGKIGFLTKDHLVTYIECPGDGKNIIIKRAGATLKTQIALNKDEIMEIIKSFSEKSKIPILEGMLTARDNDLEISAITSENISHSFVIKRVLIEVQQAKPTQLERTITNFQTSTKSPSLMPPISRPFTQTRTLPKL